MDLAHLLEAHYGVKTTYKLNPLVSQAAITVTKVLSYNPNRLGFVFMNVGSNDIYLMPTNKPAAGNGIFISGGGGGVGFVWNEDFELVSSEWFAIAIGGVSNIYVHEVTSET